MEALCLEWLQASGCDLGASRPSTSRCKREAAELLSHSCKAGAQPSLEEAT